MKKITRAMELIAASRIIKAQQRAQQAAPYARELTRAVSAVATYSNVDHPLTTEPENPTPGRGPDRHQRPRAGRRLLLERAQGGRAARRAAPRARARRSSTYISGRKGEAYFKFRQRAGRGVPGPGSPTSRTYDDAHEIGEALIAAFLAGDDERRGGEDGGATRSTSSTRSSARCWCRSRTACGCCRSRSSRARRSLPTTRCCRSTSSSPAPRRCSTRCCRSTSRAGSSSRCCRPRPPSWPPVRRR